MLRKAGAKAEASLAVDRSLQAVGFFSDGVYLRGKVDSMLVFDYLDKGRQKPQVFMPEEDTREVLAVTQAIDDSTIFPERPSGLCAWCSVKSCQYWKERP